MNPPIHKEKTMWLDWFFGRKKKPDEKERRILQELGNTKGGTLWRDDLLEAVGCTTRYSREYNTWIDAMQRLVKRKLITIQEINLGFHVSNWRKQLAITEKGRELLRSNPGTNTAIAR